MDGKGLISRTASSNHPVVNSLKHPTGNKAAQHSTQAAEQYDALDVAGAGKLSRCAYEGVTAYM